MSIFINLIKNKKNIYISSIVYNNIEKSQHKYINHIRLYNTNNNSNKKKIEKKKNMNSYVGAVLSTSLLNMESHKSFNNNMDKINNNRVIVISGATSVGKSAVARQFCKRNISI